MNFWIFQAKPERYDLRDPNRFAPDKEEKWLATRYRTRMKPGDLVYLWLAGPREIRGVYGWGRLTTTPFPMNSEYRVGVKYEGVLLKSEFVSFDKIMSIPDLHDLTIVRLAIGTNFRINQREAALIAGLIPLKYRPEVDSNEL